MFSWYVEIQNNKFQRVFNEDAVLVKDGIILNQKGTKIKLKSKISTNNYLYGDILFMIQKEMELFPMALPTKPELNLLEHPEVQRFIIDQRKKLKIQLNKYEDILRSLQEVDFDEVNFEKEFFEELSNLRSNFYRDSNEVLQEKLNLTHKKIQKMIHNTKIDESLVNDEGETASVSNSSNKVKIQKPQINSSLKALFNHK